MKTKYYIILAFIYTNTLFAQQTIKFGMGNIKNVTVTASSNSSTGIRTLLSTGYLPNQNAASRFLSQATLGATLTEINNVNQNGIESWLDTQLNMPNSFNLKNYVQNIHQAMVDSMNVITPTGNYTLANTNVDDWYFDVAWFQGSMTRPDLLRWRVGLALSEIFVTSRVSDFDGNPYALASYYDLLMNHSFGNYRALLDSITYHPTMGVYLTFLNNKATNVAKQVYPDENYAREIMQLFSIGLYKLNIDGTEMKDANNKSIPTYDNTDIANLAKVFTGLGWADRQYLGQSVKDKWSYTKRMKFYPLDSSEVYRGVYRPTVYNGHEPGSKTFLGSTVPNRPVTQGEQDIQDALNIVFNHPNVGPFMARRLIQRLISSNPSSGYIQRVATIFNNNGSGVRGDLKAVVRAILLDPEARECCSDKSSTTTGMLKEPFVRYMNLVKGLNLSTQAGVYRNVMDRVYQKTEQKPMYANTVFNFFQPDYIPDGPLKVAGKYAPEFQTLNAQTLTGYHNALNDWLINDDPVDFWYYFNGEKYKADQDPKFNITADYVLTRNDRLNELLDKYNLILAHGCLSSSTLNIIKTAISAMPYTEDANGVPDVNNSYRRIRILIYLIMSSPDYLINR